MLTGVVGELDHEQLPALHAAPDAVGPGYVGAPLLRFLQDAGHLSVGVIGELHGGVQLLWSWDLHAVDGLFLLLCCQGKTSSVFISALSARGADRIFGSA